MFYGWFGCSRMRASPGNASVIMDYNCRLLNKAATYAYWLPTPAATDCLERGGGGKCNPLVNSARMALTIRISL